MLLKFSFNGRAALPPITVARCTGVMPTLSIIQRTSLAASVGV
jgi:hypothetical protein